MSRKEHQNEGGGQAGRSRSGGAPDGRGRPKEGGAGLSRGRDRDGQVGQTRNGRADGASHGRDRDGQAGQARDGRAAGASRQQHGGRADGGKQEPGGRISSGTRHERGGRAAGAGRPSSDGRVGGGAQPERGEQAGKAASYGSGKRAGEAARTERSASRSFAVQEPGELLPFLLAKLSGQGRNAVKAILARGQVSVDGVSVTAYNHPLVPGATVSVSRDKIEEVPPLIGLSILYEDSDLIVVVKEAGLLSIASAQENELTAYRQLTEHVRRTDPRSRIFVVHRLDRDTSGVMMFAKSEEVQQALQNNWQEAVAERTYVALVDGRVTREGGTISSWLKESKTLKMYSSPYPNDGQHAVTHYKTLEVRPQFSLLEVRLETGRKNQIRVHMQDIGHPVAGDKKYGSRSKLLGRLGLHARVLAFVHPKSGELLRFETDIPKVFLNALKA